MRERNLNRAAVAVLLALPLLLLIAPTASAADPVIAAAGDIACTNSSSDCPATPRGHQKQTSDLIVNGGYTRAIVLGDNQYNSGSLSDYQDFYDPSWGRFKDITLPAPGNHDRCPESGYDEYFGYPCWYYRDVGTWRIISLDSDSPIAQAQLDFLDSALQGASGCVLAFWHHARFSSGHDGDNTNTQPFWDRLVAAGADVVLNGHSHNYERFAPMDGAGNRDDANGIREFVVGTGGAFFTGISNIKPNSQVHQNNTFGVLKMTLHPASYDWQFVPEAGSSFTDSGSYNCHHGSSGGGSDTQAPTTPQSLTATAAGPNQVNLAWSASSDNVGVTGYEIYRDGTLLTTKSTRTYSDTSVTPGQTYSYQVRAIDAAGNRSGYSNTATATPPIPDTEAPTKPGKLTADATGPFNVELSWGPSTDNVGVTGYEIYRNGSLLTTKSGTTHSDTTVQPGQTYSYEVRAIDAAGNRSPATNSAIARPVDTQPPAAPANLAANASSSSQVNLSWSATTDDVGVAGYEVFRNGAFLASAAGTSFTDTTVSFEVTNSYQVRALDGAGNRSGFSNTAPVLLTFKISADADAQVVQANPTTNYGTGATSWLRTDGGTDPDVDSYLRFTVDGIGTVQSAKLRVYAYSGTVDGPAVYATRTGWIEDMITWNTTPAVTSGAFDDKGAISTGSWVEYNVTPLVAGDGTYSFRLAQSSMDGVDFRPREYSDSTLRPQLVVTAVQHAPPPPPPDPGGGSGGGSTPGGAGSPLIPSRPFSPLGPDRTAPKLTLEAGKAQRLLHGGVLVTAWCDERCTLDAVANVKIGRTSGLFKSSSAKKVLAAGARRKLRMKFSSRSLRAIRRALALGRRVLAKVTARSNDLAGNTGSARVTIRLKGRRSLRSSSRSS